MMKAGSTNTEERYNLLDHMLDLENADDCHRLAVSRLKSECVLELMHEELLDFADLK